MKTNTLSNLQKAIELLTQVFEELNENKGEFPEERLKLVHDRICLVCNEKIEEHERSIRGLHDRCRQEQRRHFHPEAQLISLGLLAPTGVGGRPKQDRTAKAIEELAQKQAEMKQIIESQRKAKKR